MVNNNQPKDISQHLSILLLENQGMVRAGFKALLRETLAAVDVREAADYTQAIEILLAQSIDFAFLDIHLAGECQWSGLDVLQFIIFNKLDIRVIMLSVYDDEATVMRCLKEGAFGYIAKSLQGEHLLREAVETVLQNRVFLPDSVIGSGGRGMSLNTSPDEFGIKGRAVEVLYYLCQGYSNQEIASRLCLAENTVRKDYVSALLKLFKVKSRSQLLVEIARLKLVIPKPIEKAVRVPTA